MNVTTGIASPCIGVCALDEQGRACLGCGRTTDEIAVWVVMGPAERARIIGELPDRLRRREGVCAPLESRRCSRCATPFGCGANDPHNACWCARYPAVEPDAALSCLCPACLAAAATNRG